ncbi:CDP-glycerol glycerophosphotransferase family protein [Methanobrevibacter curvatus]|nr:CDP-glycerol glycerophosphotransferase family protein [Methanobrevibacter curvatus]
MSSLKKIIINTIKPILIALYQLVFHLLSTNKKVIIFESSTGRNYTGNPKYVYEYILNSRQDILKNYKIIWSLEDINTKIPGNPIKVRKISLKYLYYCTIAKCWIFDTRPPAYILKKDKCYFIQTWHGTPLKKLGLDMENVNMGEEQDISNYKYYFNKNTKNWDFLISQNPYSTEIFKKAFNFSGEFLEIGYPRNDILINKNNQEEIEKIKKELKIDYTKKIILYAPTWRDDEFYGSDVYKFTTNMDFNQLKNSLEDEYIVIIKYHYLVKENKDWTKYGDFIYFADEKTDIQKLYLISDILITDYSSVMFDYSILKRPMIFYTYDLENYKKNLRDFYFDINEIVPGPIIKENSYLIDYLKNFNEENYFLKYQKKYNEFIDKFNQYDDGKASEKIANFILKKNN